MPTLLKILLWTFVAIVVLSALYVVVQKVSKNMTPKKESFTSNNKKVTIALVYAQWCGHCKSYKQSGIFMKTAEEIKGKYNVEFKEIDADQNKDLVKKYGVNGFPTILAIGPNGEKLQEFTGDRSNKNDLIKFAQQNTV